MKTATLALDLGTNLGWALRHADGRIESGVACFQPSGAEGDGARFLKFRAWLFDLKFRLERLDTEITELRYERVDFIMPGQVYAAHCWGGFWATVTAWAEHHHIDYQGYAVGTIKAAICGNGRAKKPAIIAAVRKLGFAPQDDDEADAIALLHLDLTVSVAA